MSTPQLTQNRGRQTKVALKVTMAVTGLIFVLFVLFHMYGNLKLFLGQEEFDTYAKFLQEDLLVPILPHTGGVWLLRLVLVTALVLHVVAALVTWKRGKAARGPVQYKVKKGVKKQYTYGGVNTMRYGGLFILLFVAFHLAQFTIVKFDVSAGNAVEGSPYSLVVASFQVWWVYLIYLLAMIFLALHVNHGVFSALATLGLERTGREKGFRVLALICALAVLLGFMLPPTAILFGLIV
ncbi:MAG: succinate dehydrogenase cytochrome b subunit [Actinomycetaceae bacterium]|nr:succinate dehydrogenase cytochrome b subunit [Actinomycetaceae bacterium]